MAVFSILRLLSSCRLDLCATTGLFSSVPAALVVGTVGTTTLARSDPALDKCFYYRIYRPANSEKDFYVVGTEEIDGPWTHPAGDDMGYLVGGKKCRQLPGFMARAL